jgi:hypothetical protein
MNRWGEKMKIVTKADIVAGLQEIGLKEGDTVIVHTSLSSIGYVCGGAQTVIEALIEVVGEDGTIMMPTQSWKNLDPEAGVHWDVSEQDWDTIRENWPAYDKKSHRPIRWGLLRRCFAPGRVHQEAIIRQGLLRPGAGIPSILQRSMTFLIYSVTIHRSEDYMSWMGKCS